MMVKKIWCDLCKKEMGTQVACSTIYFGEPRFDSFLVDTNNPRNIDLCCDCNTALTDVVHNKIQELRKDYET